MGGLYSETYCRCHKCCSLIVECRFEVGDGVQAPLLQVISAAADSVLLPSHLQEVRPFWDGFQDWLTLWADTSTFFPFQMSLSCSDKKLQSISVAYPTDGAVFSNWSHMAKRIQNPIIPWFVLGPFPLRKVWLEVPEGTFLRDSVEEVVYLGCILWQPYSLYLALYTVIYFTFSMVLLPSFPIMHIFSERGHELSLGLGGWGRKNSSKEMHSERRKILPRHLWNAIRQYAYGCHVDGRITCFARIWPRSIYPDGIALLMPDAQFILACPAGSLDFDEKLYSRRVPELSVVVFYFACQFQFDSQMSVLLAGYVHFIWTSTFVVALVHLWHFL